MRHTVLASDITSEAVVFRGCTTSEISAIIVGAVLFWGPLLTILSVSLFDSLFAGLGMLMLMTVLTLLVASTYITRLKRDVPAEHYQLKIEYFLNKNNLKKYYFFSYHGEMSIGRTQQIVFVRGNGYD